jgi:hypothetical protein
MRTIKKLFKKKWHAVNPVMMDGIEVFTILRFNPLQALLHDLVNYKFSVAIENFKKNMED